ncbi:hypothetical protein FRB99_003027 [Tulasnella sp. 403]|nr:hypothetical protein FRB99_003027 [Tulasnella sp. 403]
MDDADLYSDLYGADYDEDATAQKTTPEAVNGTTDKGKDKAPDSVSNASTTDAKPIPSAVDSQPDKKPAPTSSANQPQPIPTSAAPPPVTNSIATYTSRDGNEDMHSYSKQYSNQQSLQRQPQGMGQTGEAPRQVATYLGSREADESEHTIRPSEMRDEGKMFVGGLNWETTTESLTKYFSQFGKIDACTIMRDANGRSRGFAFLTFEDPAAVNAVMVREHYLDGKIIDPKRAIPRLEHQRTQKLFVGGLAPSVTADTLRTYFSQHGNVIDATVMVDRESGRSKGFGFVTFESGNSLDHLLGHGIALDGKVIEVKLAQPRYATQRQREGGEGFNSGGNNQNFSGGTPMSGSTGASQAGSSSGGSQPAFDAQAMANLYQRMMSIAQTGGFMGAMMGGMGGMGPGMSPGMGMGRGMGMAPGMGGMGMGMGGMAPGMGGGMGGGMAAGMGGMGAGMGGGMMGPGGGGMGRGGPMMGNSGPSGPGGPGMAVPPRGPRAAIAQGPQGQQGGPGGAGPVRYQGSRGQNTYHPYGRS